MRLGGPIYQAYEHPGEWLAVLKQSGYRAAYCPVSQDADIHLIQRYEAAAEKAGILIAETGAWSNPLSRNEQERKVALALNQAHLALADEIGARCCVNIAGSLGKKWDGPYADDLTPYAFDLIVESVRSIIDAVKPRRAFYTLEPMPWMYPDSVDSYLALIRAIDRPHFAVHFDPVNLINTPERYFRNKEFIQDFVARLGPWIKSVHAKDTLLTPDRLTVNLNEVRPGLGTLDYHVLLTELHGLDADMPLMLEHLPAAEEYDLAAEYIRGVADKAGVPL
jgi:sugar phosphate isomerase/epimerase